MYFIYIQTICETDRKQKRYFWLCSKPYRARRVIGRTKSVRMCECWQVYQVALAGVREKRHWKRWMLWIRQAFLTLPKRPLWTLRMAIYATLTRCMPSFCAPFGEFLPSPRVWNQHFPRWSKGHWPFVPLPTLLMKAFRCFCMPNFRSTTLENWTHYGWLSFPFSGSAPLRMSSLWTLSVSLTAMRRSFRVATASQRAPGRGWGPQFSWDSLTLFLYKSWPFF